jgi:hypothetical protein
MFGRKTQLQRVPWTDSPSLKHVEPWTGPVYLVYITSSSSLSTSASGKELEHGAKADPALIADMILPDLIDIEGQLLHISSLWLTHVFKTAENHPAGGNRRCDCSAHHQRLATLAPMPASPNQHHRSAPPWSSVVVMLFIICTSRLCPIVPSALPFVKISCAKTKHHIQNRKIPLVCIYIRIVAGSPET